MRRTQQYHQALIWSKENKTVLCSFFVHAHLMFLMHWWFLEVGWWVVLRSHWLSMAFWIPPFWKCHPSPWETEHVGNRSNGSACTIWYTWRCLTAFVCDKIKCSQWPCVSLNGIFFFGFFFAWVRFSQGCGLRRMSGQRGTEFRLFTYQLSSVTRSTGPENTE